MTTKISKFFSTCSIMTFCLGISGCGLVYTHGEMERINLTKKAERGDAAAQYKLGLYSNDDVAIKWYKKAADQGHIIAQYELGVRSGGAESIKWYRKAADQNHILAQYELGRHYEKGINVKKSYADALIWYRKSAAQGGTDAKTRLRHFTDIHPFGLIPGVTTLNQVKRKYKLKVGGINEWTQGRQFYIDPISQANLEGINSLGLIFDRKEVLQSLLADFKEVRFKPLLDNLKKKYDLFSYSDMATYTFTNYKNVEVEFEKPNMSHTIKLSFSTKKFRDAKSMKKLANHKNERSIL